MHVPYIAYVKIMYNMMLAFVLKIHASNNVMPKSHVMIYKAHCKIVCICAYVCVCARVYL